jgi:2-hydroxychromene-2-carboxylate isomerase
MGCQTGANVVIGFWPGMVGETVVMKIEYFLSVASPWTYLGSQRFTDVVRRHGAEPVVRPMDLGEVFAASGGTLFHQRSPQRQKYRQIELGRWSRWLGLPLVLEPRFYPVDREPASRFLIAARERGEDSLTLSNAVLRAMWAEDRNIADWSVLADIARQLGHDAESLVALAQDEKIKTLYLDDTRAAILRGVFGAPTYVLNGEIFWGQDRLDFLNRALERCGNL